MLLPLLEHTDFPGNRLIHYKAAAPDTTSIISLVMAA